MIVVLIAVALAVGVFLFWPPSDEDPSDTLAEATTTATATTSSTSTISSSATSTTDDASHVVETEEEAEAILRELWFGWFEGIYNQDEDRIREVVILEETVEEAKESFGNLEFLTTPLPSHLKFSDVEILLSDDTCLAVWAVLGVSQFREGSSGGVHILRWTEDAWQRLSLWQEQGDLWQGDCESGLP